MEVLLSYIISFPLLFSGGRIWKEYVVIGLAVSVALLRELNALDMDVMAIDSDENRVNEYRILLHMLSLLIPQMKQ